MARPAILACAALVLVGARPVPATEPPVLDAIFAFDDPANCVPAPGFRQILDAWAVPQRGGGWTLGTLTLPRGYEDVIAHYHSKQPGRPGRPLAPMILEIWGNNGSHDVTALIQGSWHGLPVDHIAVWAGPPRIGTTIELGFDAPPDRVATVLSGMGFPVAEGQDLVIRDAEGAVRPRLICRFR
jgi:hypothetical protein